METVAKKISFAIARAFIFLITVYQYLLSPWMGQQCRFFPSCSCYAKEALQEFGLLKACLLIINRLARCHPWCKGGCDPIPKNKGSH